MLGINDKCIGIACLPRHSDYEYYYVIIHKSILKNDELTVKFKRFDCSRVPLDLNVEMMNYWLSLSKEELEGYYNKGIQYSFKRYQ